MGSSKGDPINKMPSRVPALWAGTPTATKYRLTDQLDGWAFYFLEVPKFTYNGHGVWGIGILEIESLTDEVLAIPGVKCHQN